MALIRTSKKKTKSREISTFLRRHNLIRCAGNLRGLFDVNRRLSLSRPLSVNDVGSSFARSSSFAPVLEKCRGGMNKNSG